MHTSLKFVGALCAILLFAGLAYGQATMSSTTTTAAVGVNDTRIYLTTTGMSAMAPNNQVLTRLYMDNEAMDVLTVPVSGAVTVRRAAGGTRRAAHASGVTVYFGPPDYFGASDPARGACTSTAQVVLPLVVPSTGNIWNCLSSIWQVINGPAAYNLGVTALGPATAGAVDMGSATYWFQDAFLGHSGTFYTKFLVTPTANRVLTFPNATDTMVGRDTTDTLTNKTLTSASVTTDIHGTAATAKIGTTAAPFGEVNLGTAATNVFTFTPAALGAARAITIADPGGAATLAYTNPTSTQTFSGGVNFGISLLPSSATTYDVGSATLPFRFLYFWGASGTPGTNNFKITGTSTSGTRVITFPDASITVPGTVYNDCGIANACSATLTSSTMKVVTGVTAALDGASPSVAAVTGMPAFTSGSSYHCVATPDGNTAAVAAGGIAITYVSSSAVTFTSANSATATVSYVCVGW